MTRQAQVGAFAILALLLLFGVFYVITDFGTRHTGYKVGIHFESAAGLHSGASVYFSGVTVGSVDSIALLPDNTVDVILAVNRDVDIPKDSRFLIQAPLTGDPNLIIVPPAPRPKPPGVVGPTPQPSPVAALPRTVLPVDEQPEGTNTATIADLLQQGQGEIKRMDVMLADLERREPQLLNTLQTALNNTNELTATMNHSVEVITAQLQTSLGQASENIVALTGTLNDSAQIDSKRLDAIMVQLQSTSVALNKSMVSLQDLATNADLKANIVATTKNIAETTQTIAELTHDLRTITGDPQTQQQVKNTVANLNATMQRANSLLGALGGTSSVYGVDQGATPYPIVTGSPYPSYPSYPGEPQTRPNGATPPPGDEVRRMQLKRRLGSLAKNLVAIQLRISTLSAQQVCCPSPLLSSDRGPQTDVNAVIFPRGGTSVLVGANDIGFNSTANFAVLQSMSPQVRIGGGVLYSRLGLLGQYNARLFGLEGRLYDLRRPTLDYYGNLNIARGTQLYIGQRDANHVERRTVYGLQFQFP